MNHTDTPLTTGEVAAIFGVTSTTVKRWTETGRLSAFRTPGGHFRYDPAVVAQAKASGATTTPEAVAS